ncbi:1055_t:CDS:2, partial [Acaulospora colombiana]
REWRSTGEVGIGNDLKYDSQNEYLRYRQTFRLCIRGLKRRTFEKATRHVQDGRAITDKDHRYNQETELRSDPKRKKHQKNVANTTRYRQRAFRCSSALAMAYSSMEFRTSIATSIDVCLDMRGSDTSYALEMVSTTVVDILELLAWTEE